MWTANYLVLGGEKKYSLIIFTHYITFLEWTNLMLSCPSCFCKKWPEMRSVLSALTWDPMEGSDVIGSIYWVLNFLAFPYCVSHWYAIVYKRSDGAIGAMGNGHDTANIILVWFYLFFSILYMYVSQGWGRSQAYGFDAEAEAEISCKKKTARSRGRSRSQLLKMARCRSRSQSRKHMALEARLELWRSVLNRCLSAPLILGTI